MNNKMIKLLAVVGGLLLMSPLAFAGSEPAPPIGEPVDGTPVIKKVKLSIAPAVGVVPCGGGLSAYTGVDCLFGDLTIAGTCVGLPVIAALRGWDLSFFGLDVSTEDITDITKEGLKGRVLGGIGSIFAAQNPDLDISGCPVDGRDYEIRRVKGFVNNAGVISAEIHLVPQE